jgi:hypothetical protein
MFPGVTDYGNYNGYNLRYVPDLHRALLHYGWTASSSGTWCGSSGQVRRGDVCSVLDLDRRDAASSPTLSAVLSVCYLCVLAQVLIYNGDEHAALAIGNCQLDQHNPSRCGTGSQWGTNIVLKP